MKINRPSKTHIIAWGRIGLGYIAAVFVGVMGAWATLEIADAIAYGRLPLFWASPGRVLRVLRQVVKILPGAMLIAAPFTVLATVCLMKLRWCRWWQFSLSGAVAPLAGIAVVQLLTMGRFFQHDVMSLALALTPTGIVAAWIYWLIGFHRKGAAIG